MKHLKRLCAGLALTLALALPVCAGQIPCGVTDPPPPAVTSGDEAGVTMASDEASEGLAETALTLLQSVLSVF